MSRIISARLSETWLKAAVVGSLWASFEIIIGSFLHNLRLPFAGTMLAFASAALIIAFVQVWKEPGMVIRAGLIAALLKSISPSAIILGPMIGIFSEAVIIEFFLLLLGRNLLGYLFAGAFAVLSALVHKIISLLVTYGFDLVIIVDQLYKYIIRQIGMEKGDPVLLITVVMLVYVLLGATGAYIGYLAGRRARAFEKDTGDKIIVQQNRSFFREQQARTRTPWLLLVHLVSIVLCLYILNVFPFYYSFIPSLLYAATCFYFYRGSMRSFRKPSFWIWFMAITILAAVFWNTFSTGQIWDLEGLMIGLRMNVRAIVILTGFAALSTELHNPIIRTVLYHHGFASLYHAVGMAFSVLPGIIDSLPGVKRLIAKPIPFLSRIIVSATDVYPTLKEELAAQPPVIILTGKIQEGKTTFLIRLTEELKSKGLKVGGFFARGIHEGDQRIGYDLENIVDGSTMVFIRKKATSGWYRHGKYYFNPEGEVFGKNILQALPEQDHDLAIIDEIGPVELKGRGWAVEVGNLVERKKPMQLWVVRRHLLKRVSRQWKIGDILIIDVSTDTVEKACSQIIKFLSEHSNNSIL